MASRDTCKERGHLVGVRDVRHVTADVQAAGTKLPLGIRDGRGVDVGELDRRAVLREPGHDRPADP